MDDDIEATTQQLEQEIAFLRNLFRSTVENHDTADARYEIATQILLASSQLNDLIKCPTSE